MKIENYRYLGPKVLKMLYVKIVKISLSSGSGCQVAGFMTVFASQLSIFTLSLLTVERWFAIRHALYTNRVDLSLATKVMFVGWAYALVLAALPLIGVSSYSSTRSYINQDTDLIHMVVIKLLCSQLS